ncbi:LysR family transcriptional regulator [Agrobacterium sp.]|uniref:LysR family transcriptional regulator n=1 Tax=Agrobacterium sp. TaxID=361 RepID=UPI0028AE3801|nr:LysR family transcriptional regulator [Agrobacterium sp.]
MDKLGTIGIFVQVAEAGSFVAAGHRLGISGSAVGKAIARLEDELDVQLFNRSTRSMALTEEGGLFLETCRRIQAEYEETRAKLSRAQAAPRGQLRVSLPLAGMLLMPTISSFMRAYPQINLDLDFTDRLVDVIEEGFDAVIRTGEVRDTRLMSRKLGTFRHVIVASPEYLKENGHPQVPENLLQHQCLHHRFANYGTLEPWPLVRDGATIKLDLPVSLVASTLEPLIYLAERSFGITCLPPFAVAEQIKAGTLVSLLDDHLQDTGTFRVLWPTSRYLSPKVRAFVDYMAQHLFAE